MAKAKKAKKKPQTEGLDSWWLMESLSTPGSYLKMLRPSGPVYTTVLEEAAWAETEPPILQFISHNNLGSQVASKSIGGNHPGSKPPIA